MSSELDNLLQRRTSILAELAALNSTASGGKPSYHIDGQAVEHTQYRLSLYDELAAIERLVNALEGPFEHQLRGET